METIKIIEDIPNCFVQGHLTKEQLEWFEFEGFFIDISPGDKVIYSCLSDPGVITQQEPTGKVVPSILGIPSLQGVMGLEDFINCGKCVECFTSIVLSSREEFHLKFNTMIKDFPPMYKKGDIGPDFHLPRNVPPSFYRKSTPEEILKKYRRMYPKKWKGIDLPTKTPPELFSLD